MKNLDYIEDNTKQNPFKYNFLNKDFKYIKKEYNKNFDHIKVKLEAIN